LHGINNSNNIKNSLACISAWTLKFVLFLRITAVAVHYHEWNQNSRNWYAVCLKISLCDAIGNVRSCNADSSIGNVLHLAYVLKTAAIWRHYPIIFHSLTQQAIRIS